MKIQTTKVYTEIDRAVKKGYKIISLQGSARSSKTYNTLIWLIIYCLQHPGTRLAIVRATLPALKGSVFVDFKEIMLKMGVWEEKKCYNKTEMIYTMPNGSTVEFFSIDSEQKLRGRKRDILYVNEANEILYLEWTQLIMRTTRFAIVDYNPSFSEDHWIYAILNKEAKTYHCLTTYKDNPFLEETIIEEIESLQHKNKSLWQIYGLGQMAVIEGLVFPEVTVIDKIPYQVKHRWKGMDFGYTNDPTAIVEVGVMDQSIYIDEICYKTHMLSGHIIKELRDNNPEQPVISESADPRLIDELYLGGINVYPVEKYPGSVKAGIMKMQEYHIYVTKNSINVLKEFRNYTYMQDKEGKWLNEPIDCWNHAIDAIRYVVLMEILGQGKPNKDSLKKLMQDIY